MHLGEEAHAEEDAVATLSIPTPATRRHSHGPTVRFPKRWTKEQRDEFRRVFTQNLLRSAWAIRQSQPP
jgi:hypothetical protein